MRVASQTTSFAVIKRKQAVESRAFYRGTRRLGALDIRLSNPILTFNLHDLQARSQFTLNLWCHHTPKLHEASL